MMNRIISLINKPLKSVSRQNLRIVQHFCVTSEANNRSQFQSSRHKKSNQIYNDSKVDRSFNQKHHKDSEKNAVFEQPIEEYSKKIFENKTMKLNEITNRKELSHYSRLSKKQEYNYFNFVIAKLYVQNMKYFNEFFSDSELNILLREYDLTEFESFFYNFTLASVLLVDFTDENEQIHYNKLIHAYVQKTEKQKDLGDEQMKIYRMYLTLRFIPQNNLNNQQYEDYIYKYIPKYFESILQEMKFYEKNNYTKEEIQFIVNFFLLKSKYDVQDATSFLKNILGKFTSKDNQYFSADSAKEIINAFITLLSKSEDIIIKNFNSFSPILENSLIAIKDKSINVQEIVAIYYVISRTEFTMDNKEQTIKLLKQLEQFLSLDHNFNIIQRKSLFYSIGKNSYLSEAISSLQISYFYQNDYINQLKQTLFKRFQSKFFKNNSFQRNLSEDNLKICQKNDKFDQYLTNLILASVQLRILNKDNIQKSLVNMIFDCASKHKKNNLRVQKLLSQVGIAFYRTHYFSIDFWKPFFEYIDINNDSHFLSIIMETSKTLKSEMEEQVASIFQEKAKQYHEKRQDKNKQAQQVTQNEKYLKEYLDANNISHKHQVYVDDQYISFQFNDKTSVLLFNINNYIISENSQVNQLNQGTQFRVDYLRKIAQNVIILNSFEGDIVEQFKQHSNKINN